MNEGRQQQRGLGGLGGVLGGVGVGGVGGWVYRSFSTLQGIWVFTGVMQGI